MSNVVLTHWNVNGSKWMLDWLFEVYSRVPKDSDSAYDRKSFPQVFSISYEYPEALQCAGSAPAKAYCKAGYNAESYVERANLYLAKLGLLGITVVVSSGDTGAPGVQGNCPMYNPGDESVESLTQIFFSLENPPAKGNSRTCVFH